MFGPCSFNDDYIKLILTQNPQNQSIRKQTTFGMQLLKLQQYCNPKKVFLKPKLYKKEAQYK